MTAPFFDPDVIAEMRATSDANRPYSAEIQSATVVSAPGGANVATWATVTTVPCRLATPEAGEEIVAAQPTGRTRWLLLLPAGTPITAKQRAVVTGVDAAGAAFSKTLEVLGVAAPLVFEIDRRVLCEEIPVT